MKASDPRSNVRLVLFDVDGVLMDGALFIGSDGEVLKPFNAKDGVAVALLQHHGIRVGVISGKCSAALSERCAALKMDYVQTGCKDKLSALEAILQVSGLSSTQVCFVGDDVLDVDVMTRSGVSYAPADGHILALDCASHVTKAAGGRGVMREVAEDILGYQGHSIRSMYEFMLISRDKTRICQ